MIIGSGLFKSIKIDDEYRFLHSWNNIDPAAKMEMILQLSPFWLTDLGATLINDTTKNHTITLSIGPTPLLKDTLSQLIRHFGKDTVAVALDEELEKL